MCAHNRGVRFMYKVSTFATVQLGRARYLCYLVVPEPYQTEITMELAKHVEAFGEQLGEYGALIQPFENAKRQTFQEVANKAWDENVRRKVEDAMYPFLLVIGTGFADFNPQDSKWALIWFEDYEETPKDIFKVLSGLARQVVSGESVFDYLKKVSREHALEEGAKRIQVRPGAFGVSIDAKAILMDLGRRLLRDR
jgi:hypothetical protein